MGESFLSFWSFFAAGCSFLVLGIRKIIIIIHRQQESCLIRLSSILGPKKFFQFDLD